METRSSSWQLAQPGAPAPRKRCYWVVEGRVLAGAYPESPDPQERGQRIQALWGAGIRTFLSLLEENERSPSGAQIIPYADTVAKLSAEHGESAKCLRFPIRDINVTTFDGMRTILNVIDLSLEANRPVYVGGVGRTGTVVGCWLRRQGLANADDVLAVLARLRVADAERSERESPETTKQRDMVLTWTEA